jgi:hypothetical protein
MWHKASTNLCKVLDVNLMFHMTFSNAFVICIVVCQILTTNEIWVSFVNIHLVLWINNEKILGIVKGINYFDFEACLGDDDVVT